MRNLTHAAYRVVPVAAVSGVVFHLTFTFLVLRALQMSVDRAPRDLAGVLVSFLFVAAFLYVLMAVTLSLSGVVAWLAMRYFHVPRAGGIALLATVLLILAWYGFIGAGMNGDLPLLLVSVASFVVAYTSSFLLLARRGLWSPDRRR